MTNKTPLTKQDLLKVVGKLATKDDLTKMESRLKDYVHEGVDTVVKTTNRRLLGLEHDTVSKKEFEQLKAKVETSPPFN